MFRRCFAALAIGLWSSQAFAWWDEGHMRVAAMAYNLLTPVAKTEANRLVRMNPKYSEWAAAVPQIDPKETAEDRQNDIDRYTFIRAATWADDIKGYPDYQAASKAHGDAPDKPDAGQNIGYKDLLIHAYWHFTDIPYSTDGSTPPPAAPVDAVTQIKLFIAALPASSGKGDDVRSYDLVWLLHLVGDVHQPLHCVSLFTKVLTQEHLKKHEPDTGDRGGNEINVLPASGVKIDLHGYWDGLFGSYSTPYGAIFDSYRKDGSPNLTAPADEAAVSDPDVWVKESYEIAVKAAYADPVLAGGELPVLTRDYETRARYMAGGQLAVAGSRLANLINGAFK